MRLPPHHSVRLELRRTPNGELNTTVYEDALQGADYFRLGQCHWALRYVVFEFHSPNHEKRFVAALAAKEHSRGGVVTWHYLVSDFREGPPAPMKKIFGEAEGFYPTSKPQFALVATVRALRN